MSKPVRHTQRDRSKETNSVGLQILLCGTVQLKHPAMLIQQGK
jgi:hypothetical protein